MARPCRWNAFLDLKCRRSRCACYANPFAERAVNSRSGLGSLGMFPLLFLLRLLVRKDWIAAIVIVFLGAITNTGGDYFWMTFLASAVIWLSIYLVLRRFGLLALVVGLVVQNILITFPMTTHLSRWYASGAIAG